MIAGIAKLQNKELIDLRVDGLMDRNKVTEQISQIDVRLPQSIDGASQAISQSIASKINVVDTVKANIPELGNTNLFDWRCFIWVIT